MCLKCESASRRFQPGEGPSRGLLRDCTTSPINRFAALIINDNSRPADKLQDNSQNTCGQEHINNFAWPIKLNICKVLAPLLLSNIHIIYYTDVKHFKGNIIGGKHTSVVMLCCMWCRSVMCLLCSVDCVLKLWKIIHRKLVTLKLYFLLLILRKLINLEITCHKKVGKIPSKLFSPFPALPWCPTCLLVCGGGGQVGKFKICKYDNTIIIWYANLKHKMTISRKLYKERQTNTFYIDINQIFSRSQ